MAHDRVHAAKAWVKDEVMAFDDVTFVGVNEDEIVVGLREENEDVRDELPDERGGIPIVVRVVGDFSATQAHADEYRPIPSGVSIGPDQTWVGTTGFVFMDDDENLYGSSNNHVIADYDRNDPGEPIFQPGIPDVSDTTNPDPIGELVDYVPLMENDNTAQCDFAWFELDPDAAAEDADLEFLLESYDVGEIDGEYTEPTVDYTKVHFSGRTTGTAEATVTAIDATVQIGAENGVGDREVENNILVEPSISESGDSGAPFVDGDGNPIGMNWGGSDNMTAMSPVDVIEQESGLTVVTQANDPREDEDDDEGDDEDGSEVPDFELPDGTSIFFILERD